MKLIFYSEKCEYSKKLLLYLEKNNLTNIFKLINIDYKNTFEKEMIELINQLDVVPTIIDTKLNQPLKGKEALKYLLNFKYFNNPTNNLEAVKNLPPNPEIPVDKLACTTKTNSLELDKHNKLKGSLS